MGAIPNFNEIKELVSKGMTLEEQQKIIRLKEAQMELQEENMNLKEEIRKLREKASIKEKIEWKAPYYFMGEDGPYCQICYDNSEKLVRLVPDKGHSFCQACKSGFNSGNQDSYY